MCVRCVCVWCVCVCACVGVCARVHVCVSMPSRAYDCDCMHSCVFLVFPCVSAYCVSMRA